MDRDTLEDLRKRQLEEWVIYSPAERDALFAYIDKIERWLDEFGVERHMLTEQYDPSCVASDQSKRGADSNESADHPVE